MPFTRKKCLLFDYKDIKKDIGVLASYAYEITQHQLGVIAIAVSSPKELDANTKTQLESAGAQLFLGGNLSSATPFIVKTLIERLKNDYETNKLLTRSNLDFLTYKPIPNKTIKDFFLEKSGLKLPPMEFVSDPVVKQEGKKEIKKAEEIIGGIPKIFLDPVTHELIKNPVITPDGITYDITTITAKKSPTIKYTKEQVCINYFAKKMLENYARDKTCILPFEEAWLCPLSLDTMVKPVVTFPEGQTYNEDSIKNAVRIKGLKDPLNKQLIKSEFIFNQFAKDSIDAYVQAVKLLDYVEKQDKTNLEAFVNPSNINVTNEDKQNALHLAISLGNVEISLVLIEKGINIHLKDNHGRTPLHLAVYEGRQEIIEKLIAKGANVDVKDDSQVSPYDLAIKSGDGNIIKLFAKRENNQGNQEKVHQALAKDMNKFMGEVSQHNKLGFVAAQESTITLQS